MQEINAIIQKIPQLKDRIIERLGQEGFQKLINIQSNLLKEQFIILSKNTNSDIAKGGLNYMTIAKICLSIIERDITIEEMKEAMKVSIIIAAQNLEKERKNEE